MNIAEVSNSMLGRDIKMDPSYIGRLRSGSRPLAKKHDYLTGICRYLVRHITKDYQINAFQKLTGIGNHIMISEESAAHYLEQWLLEKEHGTSEATSRLISGFSRISSGTLSAQTKQSAEQLPIKTAAYLYGNAGKRKAVEQFLRRAN